MNPISKLVASWKMLRAFILLVRDPSKLDEVFKIADTLHDSQRAVMLAMVEEAKGHEQGRRALTERTRLGRVSVGELLKLPEGTLGRSFGAFLHARGLDPAALPVREASDDTHYMLAHLYETHDLWHVVTGFETDVAGELGLQAFYGAQVVGNLPTVLLAIGFLNTYFFAHDDRRRRLDAITHGWMLGKQMKPLTGYRWADALSRPLEQVRAELGFRELPTAPPKALAA